MRKKLLSILLFSSASFAAPPPQLLQDNVLISSKNSVLDEITSGVTTTFESPKTANRSLDDIQQMLHTLAPTLGIAVINKVLTSLKCAQDYNVDHNNILTIIDYSLPSNEKRLWVFDLKENKLLFNTYVSHGLKSGSLLTNFFSNKNNSKATSLGVYTTEKSYFGRHGVSLQLDGLERGFNDNAANRAVVLHGGWYVEEDFIKKYGRAGRSWGCPAVPDNLSASIINTIKEKSLFVAYYPNDDWLAKSRFLNCYNLSPLKMLSPMAVDTQTSQEAFEPPEEILFADIKNNYRAETEPVVVMAADNYEHLFHTKPPLTRMLRRQINHMEYVALNGNELKTIATTKNEPTHNQDVLNEINFVIPVVKMVRGYYETDMQILNYGKITDIKVSGDLTNNDTQPKSYSIQSETKPNITLKPSNRFVRWVGL